MSSIHREQIIGETRYTPRHAHHPRHRPPRRPPRQRRTGTPAAGHLRVLYQSRQAPSRWTPPAANSTSPTPAAPTASSSATPTQARRRPRLRHLRVLCQSAPQGLALDADRRELYIVSDITADRVFVRNADTFAAVRDYDTSAFSIRSASVVALDAARRELYIAGTAAGVVFVRNADTLVPLRRNDFSAFSVNPRAVALDADRRELYIADLAADRVFVRNADTGFAVRDYDISAFSNVPQGLALDAARRELYIADAARDRVFVRNADTLAPATYPSNIILRSPRELNIGDPRPITHIQRGRFASGQPHLTPYNTPLAEITVEIPEPLAERRVSSGELRKFTDSEHPTRPSATSSSPCSSASSTDPSPTPSHSLRTLRTGAPHSRTTTSPARSSSPTSPTRETRRQCLPRLPKPRHNADQTTRTRLRQIARDSAQSRIVLNKSPSAPRESPATPAQIARRARTNRPTPPGKITPAPPNPAIQPNLAKKK